MRQRFVIGLIIVILAAGGIFMYKYQAPKGSPLDYLVGLSRNEKTFQIEAKNFEFSLKEIRVKKGDKVKIILNGTQGFHDIVIDEFNVASARIQSPSSATVEFVADKMGSFQYYCSVGTHRQMGMVGTLIVE